MQTAVRNLAAFPAPDESETQALTNDIQAQLDAIPQSITDAQSFDQAQRSLLDLKRIETKVVEFFKPMKDAANKAHKAICNRESQHLKPIRAVHEAITAEATRFRMEKDELRRVRERQLQEEERRRQENVSLAEAEAVSATSPELAEQIMQQAISAPMPTVVLPNATPTVEGVSFSANWKWRFQGCAVGVEFDKLPDADKRRIVDALPKEFLRPDERSITKVVKALRSATRIAGIEAFDAGSVRVRA